MKMENLNFKIIDSQKKPERPIVLEQMNCQFCQDVGICSFCERGQEENRIHGSENKSQLNKLFPK
jgi:hypothetical protein